MVSPAATETHGANPAASEDILWLSVCNCNMRTVVPDAPRTARRSNAAIVIHRETALPANIAAILRRSGIEYERSDWRTFAIFSGIDSTRIHRGVGLARRYAVDDWPPLPKQSDGFN